jgi:hypothetical protein
MCLVILMLVFGIIGLAKGEFKITGGRMVRGSTGRTLGAVLIIGAAAGFLPDYGSFIQIVILILVIVLGLVSSEKIEKAPAAVKEMEPAPPPSGEVFTSSATPDDIQAAPTTGPNEPA